MKKLSFGNPLPGEDGFKKWAINALQTIARASAEDIETIIAEFSVTGSYTKRRTFDASSASTTVVREVLATLIDDINLRGQKRGY